MILSRAKRQRRIRAKIHGRTDRPRLCVFRSNKHIYAQLIDDDKNKTIVSAKDSELKLAKGESSNNMDAAFKIGELMAKKAQEKKIVQVVFDRSGYKYHGKIKALAEGARKGGLKF
ncbi:MAG: 50S ribosomal protein L18 [Patescibacteria group bacterium]|nr:50S ribosomal protein L18 [Patescibacteria group bacterium]